MNVRREFVRGKSVFGRGCLYDITTGSPAGNSCNVGSGLDDQLGFDDERAIGRRVVALYDPVVHQGRGLARRQQAVFVATLGVVPPAGEMSVHAPVHRQ